MAERANIKMGDNMQKIGLILVLLIIFGGCSTAEINNSEKKNKTADTAQNISGEKPKMKTLAEQKELWIEKFNSEDRSIADLYDKEANFIINNEFISSGKREEFFNKLLLLDGDILRREVQDVSEYDKTRVIEKGKYIGKTKEIYYVNVWEKTKKSWYISVEMIYEIINHKAEITGLDESRKKYEELGTTKDLLGFVKNVFDENGAYFHNGEFFIGTQTIYNRFKSNMVGYDEFSMGFEKEGVMPLSDDLVVDYGKYNSGDTKGNYFFLWKKQSDRSWKIYLDLCIF